MSYSLHAIDAGANLILRIFVSSPSHEEKQGTSLDSCFCFKTSLSLSTATCSVTAFIYYIVSFSFGCPMKAPPCLWGIWPTPSPAGAWGPSSSLWWRVAGEQTRLCNKWKAPGSTTVLPESPSPKIVVPPNHRQYKVMVGRLPFLGGWHLSWPIWRFYA